MKAKKTKTIKLDKDIVEGIIRQINSLDARYQRLVRLKRYLGLNMDYLKFGELTIDDVQTFMDIVLEKKNNLEIYINGGL